MPKSGSVRHVGRVVVGRGRVLAARLRPRRRRVRPRVADAAVPAREDAAVVAEDAVLAGAAGDPVLAPAADTGRRPARRRRRVVAAAAVDGVVAGLAVHLVAPPMSIVALAATRRRCRVQVGIGVAARRRSPASRSRSFRSSRWPKSAGLEVRAARRVVEQRDAADDELRVRVVRRDARGLARGVDVVVVDEADVARRRARRRQVSLPVAGRRRR